MNASLMLRLLAAAVAVAVLACGGPNAAGVPAGHPQGAEPAEYAGLAFVQFADSLGRADLQWLREEGFAIVRTFPDTHSATVRVPADYAGDPLEANPRIVRFEVRTIPPPSRPDTRRS